MFGKRILSVMVGISLMVGLAACSSAEATATTEASPTQAAEVSQPTSGADNTAATTEEAAATEADASAPVTCSLLNLNTVTAEQLLATIPGFSDRMTREFAEYRPYVSIQQFRREIGKYVDEATIEGYEQYVYVPIIVNDADTDTLMQIPGVDAATAETLIAARPFASNQAFVDQLSELIGGDQAAAATCYLDAE